MIYFNFYDGSTDILIDYQLLNVLELPLTEDKFINT
jgi:hypothetical protein